MSTERTKELETLLKLAALANDQAGQHEGIAAAAKLAERIVRLGPLLLTGEPTRDTVVPRHPFAQLVHSYRIELGSGYSYTPTICDACGNYVAADELRLRQQQYGISTHQKCRDWWFSVDFSKLPPLEDDPY